MKRLSGHCARLMRWMSGKARGPVPALEYAAAGRRGVSIPAEPLSLADHWRRTAAVVEGAIMGAGRAAGMQRAAAAQLDSAAYAFELLLEELQAAMPLPRLASAPVLVAIAPKPSFEPSMTALRPSRAA